MSEDRNHGHDMATSSSVSSQRLHPVSGARFLFELLEGAEYRVTIYRAGGTTFTTVVAWDGVGQLVIAPPLSDEWAREEVIKLARVLHRDRKARLLRWRA